MATFMPCLTPKRCIGEKTVRPPHAILRAKEREAGVSPVGDFEKVDSRRGDARRSVLKLDALGDAEHKLLGRTDGRRVASLGDLAVPRRGVVRVDLREEREGRQERLESDEGQGSRSRRTCSGQ